MNKPIKQAAGILLSLSACFVSLQSCGESTVNWPDEEDLTWKINPVLPSDVDGFDGLGDYRVTLYMFNNMTGECLDIQSSSSFGGLKPMVVEKASYDLRALMTDGPSLNLDYDATTAARRNQVIRVRDIASPVPDIVVGKTIVQQDVKGDVVLSELDRLVGRLEISLIEVPADVSSISVEMDGFYDCVNLDGDYSMSGEEPLKKTLELVRDGSVWKADEILFPSVPSASGLTLKFLVSGASGTDSYLVNFEEGIVAGKVASLVAKAGEILTKGSLSMSFTYSGWNGEKTIEDDLDLKKDPWYSTPLKIGGSGSYDNFWASSSLEGQYDSYLYDGVKDEEHKEEYWCPDVSWDNRPTWRINLGSPREGVTVTWWNKFGGAGGQKIRTMEIYASSLRSDYSGGESAWKLVGTFTSEFTLPTTDAGAMVTTGRIEFDGGASSYQYLKCVSTSRVSNTGAIIEDGDVNVAEVEIVAWNCK